jgi:hypothetical protein
MARVLQKVHLHTDAVAKAMSTLQAKELRKKHDQNALEWVSPKSKEDAVAKPKRRSEVIESCEWFLKLDEYKDWTGDGPQVLICTGKRMLPCEPSNV